MTTCTFEDFTPGLRFDFAERTMSVDEIVAFACEFDPQPMHLDEEAGRTSILGGLAASGWHTSAVMMRMLYEAYIRRSSSEGSPGVDLMEWKRPVIAGDTLPAIAWYSTPAIRARGRRSASCAFAPR